MKFTDTRLKGVYIIDLDKKSDDRGFFARSWCQKEFEERRLVSRFVQANVSWNKSKGTLRGMHYQTAPHQESKLVRCTRGAIYDVVLDVRPGSPTFGQWIGTELTQDNYQMFFVPGGCATGYLTLQDNTEVAYQVSEFYSPSSERGIRYNDPAFGIKWPISVCVISEKDRNWADYRNDHC